MATVSGNRGFTYPTPSSDIGLWGTELNGTLTEIDTILGGTAILYSSNGMAATLAASQAQNNRLVVVGAFSTSYVITFPIAAYTYGNWLVWNNSSASSSYPVVCTSTGGVNVLIPPLTMRMVNFDGTNMQFADNVTIPLTLATVNFNISGGGATPPPAWYGEVKIPYTFTTSSYTITASTDAQGAAQVKVWHAYAPNYPSTAAAAEATLNLSSAGYLSAGVYGPFVYGQNDLMGFSLVSSTSVTTVNIAISGTRSLSS